MRKWINLVETVNETYSEQNSFFKRYMQDSEFDPYDAWFYVSKWIMEHGLMDELGLDPDMGHTDMLENVDPDVFYQLSDDDQEVCKNECLDEMMENEAAEAPTWHHAGLNSTQLIHRTTWLVHFSDYAENLASEGFTKGISDVSKLGLTTHYTDQAKKHGGYAFAFLAESNSAYNAESYEKYGSHAVLFQNSGVHIYHYGDQEDQIVFWGADVKPRDMVLLLRDGRDWEVVDKNNVERVFYKGRYKNVVNWVKTNFVQYRKALTGQ